MSGKLLWTAALVFVVGLAWFGPAPGHSGFAFAQSADPFAADSKAPAKKATPARGVETKPEAKPAPVAAKSTEMHERGHAEIAILKALASSTQLEFVDTPLADVVNYLEDYHKINIHLDQKAMEDAGIPTDKAVTINIKGVTLRSALDLLLRRIGLAWTIRDEVLLVTAPDEADSHLVTKVYDVADLVAARDEDKQVYDDYDTLIEAVRSTIAPTSWDQVGGAGSVVGATFGSARVLVVSQTWQNQEAVAQLFQDLRAAAPKGHKDEQPPLRPRRKTPAMGGMSTMGGSSPVCPCAGGAKAEAVQPKTK